MFPFPGVRRRLFVWHRLRLLAVATRTYPDFWFACAWQNKPLKRMAAFRAFQRQDWHHTPPQHFCHAEQSEASMERSFAALRMTIGLRMTTSHYDYVC